jgi:hypothetical protein
MTRRAESIKPKNMKKIIISMLCLLTTVATSAQYYHRSNYPDRYGRTSTYRNGPTNRSIYDRWSCYNRNSYFGLRLGVNSSTLFYNDQNGLDRSSDTGLNVGFVMGWQVTPSTPLFFETGLLYTEKGADVRNNNSTIVQKESYDLNYLEVPLVFKYKYFVTNDVAIQPYFGGFLAVGVAGKTRIIDSTNKLYDRSKSDSFDDDYFKRFDGGLRLGCGVSFQNVYFDLSYDIGLANIAHDNFDRDNYDNFDGRIHTGCFSATIGVDF